MKRSVIAAALAAGLVLAGCDNGGTEPAPPPTSEEALSTATAPPTPTPSDEVEVTTEAEAAPTTQAPEADGPPEMPKEALEQTEAGAEAFALHYIDLINYTGKHPETGLLEPLGGEDCQSCRNHEDSVAYGMEHGDYLAGDTFEAGDAQTLLTDNSARVEIPVDQPAQPFLRDGEEIDRALREQSANLVIRLDWNDGWTVSEITVA